MVAKILKTTVDVLSFSNVNGDVSKILVVFWFCVDVVNFGVIVVELINDLFEIDDVAVVCKFSYFYSAPLFVLCVRVSAGARVRAGACVCACDFCRMMTSRNAVVFSTMTSPCCLPLAL